MESMEGDEEDDGSAAAELPTEKKAAEPSPENAAPPEPAPEAAAPASKAAEPGAQTEVAPALPPAAPKGPPPPPSPTPEEGPGEGSTGDQALAGTPKPKGGAKPKIQPKQAQIAECFQRAMPKSGE